MMSSDKPKSKTVITILHHDGKYGRPFYECRVDPNRVLPQDEWMTIFWQQEQNEEDTDMTDDDKDINITPFTQSNKDGMSQRKPVPFRWRQMTEQDDEEFGVIKDANDEPYLIDATGDPCACCNDEITRPHDGDPWEGRLDAYCYYCALCRCDALPSSCGKSYNVLSKNTVTERTKGWEECIIDYFNKLSRESIAAGWEGPADNEEIFTGQVSIDDAKHNKLFGFIDWSAGPGIDRTKPGATWFAWINRWGMAFGYRRLQLFISFPSEYDGWPS
jgi:hypothetical protein